MRVLVCGSRTWTNCTLIIGRFLRLPAGSTIIHGAAQGADHLAGVAARHLGLSVEEHPARWALYGKRAGFVRNDQMLDTRPDLVLAFWDGVSRGTMHTVRGAAARNIPVEVIEDPERNSE